MEWVIYYALVFQLFFIVLLVVVYGILQAVVRMAYSSRLNVV